MNSGDGNVRKCLVAIALVQIATFLRIAYGNPVSMADFKRQAGAIGGVSFDFSW